MRASFGELHACHAQKDVFMLYMESCVKSSFIFLNTYVALDLTPPFCISLFQDGLKLQEGAEEKLNEYRARGLASFNQGSRENIYSTTTNHQAKTKA